MSQQELHSDEEESDGRPLAPVLQEALGVTPAGTCVRHPNCPVLSIAHNKVMSCRVCFSEEKSVGIRQRKSFAAVVQQLHELSAPKDADKGQGDSRWQDDTERRRAHQASMQHLLMQQPQTMESVMKRLTQVQNWLLRQKEKEVLSLQLHIHRLEERLSDAEMTINEQKQTIRSLRLTIQQDLKIIKTMTVQKEKDSLELSGLSLQSESHHLDETQSPASNNNQHGPKTASPEKSVSPPRRKPTKSWSMGAQRTPPKTTFSGYLKHLQPPPIREEETGGSFNSFSASTYNGSKHQGDIFVEPRRNQYWNPDSELGPSQIFKSFRGGLLDIPKSPPPPRHDNSRRKLHIDATQMKALKMPEMRQVSRSLSGDGDSQFTSPKEIPLGLDLLVQQKDEVDVNGENTEGPLEPSPPPPPFSSPLKISEPIDPEEKPEILPLLPPLTLGDHDPGTQQQNAIDNGDMHVQIMDETDVPNGGKVPDITSDLNGTESAAVVLNEEASERFLFNVTSAECSDKYGDTGYYTGSILVTEGMPHGKGIMNYDSGRVYDGDWVSGQWHGKGKLLNPNGDTYVGDFVFDTRHGEGVYKWDNGDIYVGQFSQDKRHGQGRFSFHNGNIYEGEFFDGMFEGFGKYKFQGGYYEGNWKQGRYDGSGTLKYINGAKYTGEFRNSVAHGFGMEVTPDGKKRRGVWEDGQPVDYFERS